MSGQHVEILIDELVMDGFSPADRYRIAEAFSRELEQLVTSGGPEALVERGDRALLRGGEVPLAPRAKAEGIGSQIARAVHTSLTQEAA